MAVIEKRSVGLAILLSVVTCGIYLFYWEYKIWDGLYKANNQPSTAGTDVLLSFVTCGIYMFYMLYKAGKLESSAMALYELPQKDDSILYLILAFVGLAIVSLAILQSNLNILADHVNAAYNDPQRRQS